MLKKTINAYLKKRGLYISPYDPYFEKLEPVKNNWLKNYGFNTIIDIGASNGGFARKARQWFPNARIISFEPIPESYTLLVESFKNDKNFKAYNTACSNVKDNVRFYLSSNSGSSSLLNMEDNHKTAYPDSATIKEISVNTNLLDNLLKDEILKPEILLKLDTQGSELLALEGAPSILEKTKLLFVETSFNQLYKDQPLVNEVIDWLYKRHFRLVGVENVSNSLIDGSFLQSDMFFERF